MREYQSLSDVASAHGDALGRAGQPDLFDRLDWFTPLARHCFAEQTPAILHAREGGAEAWLFLARTGDRRLSALANYYSFAWRPIFAGENDRETRKRLLTAMARHLRRDTAHVDLYPMIADDGMLGLMRAAFRAAGWIAIARPMGGNHRLIVGGRAFDDYWKARGGALRATVRRKGRNRALSCEVHRGFDAASWADYEAIYARSWKPEEGSMPFLRAMAETEGAAGTLRLGIARLDGRAVAAQLWTVENGVALIHKLAHEEASQALSPGTLLSAHMFRRAIDADRVAVIDYGTGDNPYKTEWMEERRPLHRLDCFNPRFPAAWPAAVKCGISKLVGHRTRG